MFSIAAAIIPSTSFAHGVVGQSFSPTIFAVDDPFISDEFSLLYNSIKMNDQAGGPEFRLHRWMSAIRNASCLISA
jgi:hypothetical protein